MEKVNEYYFILIIMFYCLCYILLYRDGDVKGEGNGEGCWKGEKCVYESIIVVKSRF